jgi:hypothetical protein
MIIKETQIQTLGSSSKLEFIEKTIAFLRENVPDWATSKEDDEIRGHIESMIEMGSDRNISKEINIQKLLYHCLRFGLRIPFNKRVEELLAFDVLSEDERVKRLIKEIRSGHVS